MRITTKTAAALLGLFLALILGAWLILDRAILPGFARLESESIVRDQARIEARITAITGEMQNRALDYAHWDDTYHFIEGDYPEYTSDNFTADWFANYAIDFNFVVDNRGNALWSGAPEGADPSEVTSIADAIIRDARASAKPDGGAAGVIWGLHGPVIYAAEPALRTDGSGPPLGLVVFARRIATEQLAEELQLHVTLVSVDAPPVALQDHLYAMRERTAQTWFDGDHANIMIALRDGRGRMVGALFAERTRDIMNLGRQSIAVALGLFAAISGITIGALWLLLRRLVISRVLRLETHLRAQVRASSLEPYAASRSRDEIGRLTRAYNELVLRVRAANESETKAIAERESAAAANRMKSDFLANISHELRTPLNAVIGYAELVQEELADSGIDTGVDDLQRIRGAGRHLLTLVNEILDLSKIEAGRLELTPASFQVAEMVSSVIDTITPLARQSGSALVLQIAPDLGEIYSDEFRLRQCLINVLSNACKFTADGEITLSARREKRSGGDVVHFEVKDTGIGMTPSQLAKVFEPFVQADATITRRFGGTGLGLAITRKIMTLLGGTIDAHSAVGKGSTFVLIAPAIAIDRHDHADEAPGEAVAA